MVPARMQNSGVFVLDIRRDLPPREAGPGGRDALRAGRFVLNLLGLAQGIHRFVNGQKDSCFQRAKRTAATNRQRNRLERGRPDPVVVA